MPIQPTSDPNRLRCTFSYDEKRDGIDRTTEVVAFIQLTPLGMKIIYDYHLFRVRSAPLAPPPEEFKMRSTITPTMQAFIMCRVQDEWWNHFQTSFETSDGQLS